MRLLERGHHLAHVLHALRAGRLDRLLDRGLGLGLAHLLGQVGLDDLDLAALLLRELVAAAFDVDVDRLLALLDHLLQEPQQLLVGERGLAGALGLDVGVLDRGIDQAQRGQRELVLRPHRRLHGLVDPVAEHSFVLFRHLLSAISAQIASTTPNGRCLEKH